MAENQGTVFLKDSDFAEVVDAEGNPLPSVPKHWTEDDLAPGAKFKTKSKSKSAKASKASGSTETEKTPEKPEDEPAGNASAEDWVAYARDKKGAKDEDLVDEAGEPLGRDALREKFGTKSS